MALPFRGPVAMSTDETSSGVGGLYEAYGRLIGHRYSLHDVPAGADRSHFANISLPDACATQFQGGSARFDMSSNEAGLDLVILSFPFSGQSLCYRQGRAECVAATGEAILHTTDAPLQARADRLGAVMAVAMPRRKLERLVNDPDTLTLRRLPRENPALSLLSGHARNFLALGAAPDAQLAALIGDQLCDLAVLALGANATGRERIEEGEALAHARYRRAMDYIGRHLANPALSERDVARHLGVSPSSVRKLFARHHTTPARSIRTARVERAAALLSDPNAAPRKIVAVAFEAGFHSVSAFYEAFRERYDTPPGDLRSAALRRHRD